MSERKQGTAKPAAKKSADKAGGEAGLLAKIAAMPEPFHALGERAHALMLRSAQALHSTLWYGMPAYERDGRPVG